ncbi:MAG TPA: A/G-specific adenine glycosylase [Gemmataceae bacterium]|nr:A/G-specific adenine glycosylase [Gemmataceae bacterium]
MPDDAFVIPRDFSRLRRRLLIWFDRHRRDLPWRRDRDPYRIWVSEVMLQQTTVAAVGPYFERFIDRFPTLTALAEADEQKVLRLWEGLGFYRRARHLHQAARNLATQFGGRLPDDPAVWAKLPGVGRYILGAVLSQAFDRRLPIIEANSRRVLCRLFGYTGDPRSAEGQKWLWETGERILPTKRVGDFNQAVMELGALVCTPTAPACERCPAAADCVARAKGLQESIPQKATRLAVTEVREVAVAIRRGPRVLLAQRPPDAVRWAGMWEFPHGELGAGEDFQGAAERIAGPLTSLDVSIGPELLTVRHTVTRFRITLVCLEAEHRAGRFGSEFYSRGRWLRPAELADYPVSTPQRRLARAVAAATRQRRLF